MSDYEIALIWAAVLLSASLLVGFGAVTNHRSVVPALFIFVLGGLALFYAQNQTVDANLAMDLPRAIYKLYARIMN